jgi:CrcB protein
MTQRTLALVLVGAGGLAGSVARYVLSLALQRFSAVWPAGTLASNLLGCLVIGAFMELAGRTQAVSPETRLLVATGFCGGFTTMSSFVYESHQFLTAGEWLHATGYFAATLGGSAAAFLFGVLCVRMVFHAAGALWN